MRILSLIFLLIIILFGVTFAILNADAVTINYYFGTTTLPISLLMVSVFSAGCLLGLIANVVWLFKYKVSNYRLKQRLKMTEKELDSLRIKPLQENR